MEYPKIHSLWKREGWYFDQEKKKSPDYQKGRQSFIVGDYAEPEFASINKWRVYEKVDGTNIRVMLNEYGVIKFGGRTNDAQIPCHLLDYLQSHFTLERLSSVFPLTLGSRDLPSVCLYGEGYGPKIQSCGGNYRKEAGFILFDVRVGNWWLKHEDIRDIANKLEIPIIPHIGIMKEEDIIDYVQSKMKSLCSVTPQTMEGVMCKSEPLMLFRKGGPIMWKLKCKEF